MLTSSELAGLPLFEDLTDDELAWVLANSYEQALAVGEVFMHEGDPADRFYVVLEGELQIARTLDGTRKVMGTTPRGIIGGEISLLNAVPSMVTVQAIAPSRILVMGVEAFRQMFAAAPTLGSKVLQIASQRMYGFASMRQQQEKLAALGQLSAGLAHELNNPASAARRAAVSLREMLPSLQARALRLGVDHHHLPLERLTRFQGLLIERQESLPPMSSLERSDYEDQLGDWLDDHGVAEAYALAAPLVAVGVTVAELAGLISGLEAATSTETLGWIAEAATVDGLLAELELSTRRVAELVAAVKAYSYMDQAPIQEVDLNRDLAHTLVVLRHRLKGITVVNEYSHDLPALMGRGGELNQVWTNLIVNAADALKGSGTIKIITRCEHNFAMVEVADDGPGIPPDVLPRIFEPFFTTKGVGTGTGLGLDISYRIITQHNGTIEVQSQPGATRFIVRLPVSASGASA
ncbi:ATP-binding protein [Candidatus Chloroploca sp. Khr17]|uniref:ATP-binding protein n=1 Tax=Candidatus Chloroploca sp. Khr17 TaxID=2496869 RepID=UPI00101CB63D|nr:ATP-binding protein [Candidatus Chloroploca sp. Khr17]